MLTFDTYSQVPWTKLGFDPVVITINTMECILSLRNADDSLSDTASNISTSTSSQQLQVKKSRSRKKLQDPEAAPGYVQSLLNRLVHSLFGVAS